MAIQDEKNMPKSRVTLRYRTQINGVPEDITLPMRILIAGDFSGHGTQSIPMNNVGEADSSGLRLPLDKRHVFDATEIAETRLHDENGRKLSSMEQYNPIMKLLRIKCGDSGSEIQLKHLDAFAPDRILENSRDEVKNQLEIKRLLSEVISNITNNKRYRQAIEDLLTSDENQEQGALSSKFENFLKIYEPQTRLQDD